MADGRDEATLIAIVADRLGRIEKKIDEALADHEQRLRKLEGADSTDPDHESRIRTLERWMWALPTSLLGAAASILVALVK